MTILPGSFIVFIANDKVNTHALLGSPMNEIGVRILPGDRRIYTERSLPMNFSDLLSKVRSMSSDLTPSPSDFLAVQVNIEDEGVFYVEVKDGQIHVEPYEYNDRHCAITMKMDNFVKLIDGELDPVKAFTFKKLKVDGDLGKALEFSRLLKK